MGGPPAHAFIRVIREICGCFFMACKDPLDAQRPELWAVLLRAFGAVISDGPTTNAAATGH